MTQAPQWIDHEAALVRRLWGNGGRSLIISGALALCSIFVLAAAIVYSVLTATTTFAPFAYTSPQHVITSIVVQGGFVGVDATKCSKSLGDVAFDSRSWWRRLSDNALIPFKVEDGLVRASGCTTLHFENLVPFDLPPGSYQLEGVDTAYSDDGRVQHETWKTQPFQIIAVGK